MLVAFPRPAGVTHLELRVAQFFVRDGQVACRLRVRRIGFSEMLGDFQELLVVFSRPAGVTDSERYVTKLFV